MSGLLDLQVATPSGLALKTHADEVEAPSVHGEFGVLPGHVPLLASLRSGLLHYTADGQKHFAAVGPGFVKADSNSVLLLTELYTVAEQVNAAEVESDIAETEAKIRNFVGEADSPERLSLEVHLDWSLAKKALLAATAS